MAKPGPPKGTRPSGRKKGTPNKFTQIKRDMLEAFKTLGGTRFVLDCAKTDPVAVLRVIAGLLPKEIEANVNMFSHEETLKDLE